MKKYLLMIISAFVLLTACTDDNYENLNVDPYHPQNVSPDFLFNSATKSLFDQMTSTNVNLNVYRLFAQYWTETTYIDESNYDLVTRGIASNHWNRMYRDVLNDFQDAKKRVDLEVKPADISAANWTLIQNNKKAMISTLEVYAWQQLVDTYGNVPYTDALKGLDNVAPKYDDAAEIYKSLFTRIDAAIGSFDATQKGFNDFIYHGNVAQWEKFANSLKLRLAMRVADYPVLQTISKNAAQQAAAAGVFTSNNDNFKINYEGGPPNTNPVWLDLVQSGRSDFVAANTIVDYMNAQNDPRRPEYFKQNLGANVYDGGIYGANNNFDSYTQVGLKMYQPTNPACLIDYSEVQFHLAHAAAMNYSVGGTADVFYTNGITASMQYWGADNVAVAQYLLRPDVVYATAPGTWREKIGYQFWLAMYNRGFEGWTVWRQFDAPVHNVADDSGDTTPFRYTYPIPEQTRNLANYTAASAAIGGDDLWTKLFWDVY